MINYNLKRYKRKSIGIYIINGEVEVRAPNCCPVEEIDKFVESKEEWIKRRLVVSQEQAERKKNFSLNYGSEIYVRGVAYPIVSVEKARPELDGKCLYLPSNLDPAQIKHACIKAYFQIAKEHFSARVAEFAKIMNVEPASVSIYSAKGRWGSCCSCKKLHFSWRLMMGSDYVIDYVVVHELAHILEMNHSKDYWAIVENILPDYKQRRIELNALHRQISSEDWD